MVAAVLAIIMALISYFGSKKAGATDAQAAMVGVAAGAGSYYVATQTEWGKGLVGRIEDWVGITGSDGEPLLNGDGTPATAPKGAIVVTDENGNPKRDPSGNILWKAVDSAGNVLESWGPEGTAKVVATTGVVSALHDFPWLLVGAGVLTVIAISR